MYRLKEDCPAFEAVDGPLAGKKFKHGKNYSEVPEGDKARFEIVKESKKAKTVSVVVKTSSRQQGKPFGARNSKPGPEEKSPPTEGGEGKPEEAA